MATITAPANGNLVEQLRELSDEALATKRSKAVRICSLLKWTHLPVLGALLLSLILGDLAVAALFLGAGAVQAIAFLSMRTRVWFIDLVLSERTSTEEA